MSDPAITKKVLNFLSRSLALSLMLCLTTSIDAQRTNQNRERTRQLERVKTSVKEVSQSFEQREADGLQVSIYQFSANGIVPVSPSKAFNSRDRFKLRLQANFDGYIYVINVTPGGQNRLLFPRAESRGNNVRAGQYYYVPADNDFQFDDEPGIEVLQILMSRSRVSFLDTALDRAPKKASHIPLDAHGMQSLEQLAGKPSRLRVGGITTRSTPRSKTGTQTRMLILDRKKDSTFLIVSGDKEVSSRLRPGEISVFEVRLNHR
jgi:Domain of unknown function (DUF4384)